MPPVYRTKLTMASMPQQQHVPASQPRCCAGSSPAARCHFFLTRSWWVHPGSSCWRTSHSGCRRSSRPSASPRWPSPRPAAWCHRSTQSRFLRCRSGSRHAPALLPSLHTQTRTPSCLQGNAGLLAHGSLALHVGGAEGTDFTSQSIIKREQFWSSSCHSLVSRVNLFKEAVNIHTQKKTSVPIHVAMLLILLILAARFLVTAFWIWLGTLLVNETFEPIKL